MFVMCLTHSFSVSYAQTFLNGSFETTTATMACNYNLGNGAFNGLMSNTNAFGTGNETDILINGCFTAGIPNGVRAIGLAATYDEVSLALSAPLVAGNSYMISFWSYGEVTFRPLGGLQIGLSTTNNTFGTPIGATSSVASTWVNHTFCFVAPNNGSFITVRNTQDGIIHWNHIDHFQFIVADASFDFNDFCAGSPNGPTNIITPGGTFSFNPVPFDGATINPVTGVISNGVNGATYTVQYTLGGACPSSSTETVTVTGISYTSTNINENCGASDGEISLTPVGGVPAFTYSIDNGATSQASGLFTGLAAGSYNVLITDNNGCTATGTEVLANLAGLTIDNITPTNPSCSGACDGSISVSVSGGAPPYTYQWYDAAMAPIGTNSASITGLCDGNYSVEVSDASGGTTQLFYDDFETGAAGWNLNVPLAAEGADPNFFQVDDDEGGVAPGGCGIAGNGDATLHITSVFFPGGGAAYDAGGLCGFLFCPETHRRAESPVINTVGQTGLTLNFDFIAQGNIPSDQATVWYFNGATWNQLGAPLFSGTGACAPQGIWTAYSAPLPASCENIANLRIAIRWDNNDDGVGTDPSVAINNIEIVTSGAAGCSATQIATLTDPLPADPTFILTDFCEGNANSATGIVTPGGTFVYNPNPADGSTVNAATGAITNGIAGTTYTIQYTTPGACPETMTNTVTVNGVDYTATIVDETCGSSNGEIDLTPVGGSPAYTYSIDNGATSQAGGLFTGLVVGTYDILITDNNGCQVIGTETIANIGGPTITTITPTNPSCPGVCDGQITITVTGGTAPYTYEWFDGLGNPVGTNSATITGLCDDNYSVQVTDAGGGGATQLNTNSGFEVGPGGGCGCPTGFNCNNDAGQVFDGVMPVYVPGNQGCVTGATNYTNALGANSGTGYVYFYAGADNVSAGPYTFLGGETVDLCVWYAGPQGGGAPGQNTAASHFSFGMDGVQIGPDVPVPTNTGWTQYCFTVVMTAGNHTFQILSGGAAQYALWFDDFTINNMTGGGGAGCTVTSNTSLIDPLPADPTFTLTDFCEGNANAATGIMTPGGTFAYNPNPADGSTVNAATGEVTNGVVGTTYTIQYTTPGACPATMTNTVTVNGVSYTAVVTDATCGASDGEISLTPVGGVPAFNYSIDNGATSQAGGLFTGLASGSYDVLITDGNGCQTTGTETVANIGGPTITSITPTNPSCALVCDGEITVAVAGGTLPYTFQWFDVLGNPIGPNAATITGLCAGDYSVDVSDAAGACFDNSIATLTDPLPADPTFVLTDFCLGDANAATGIVTPGGTFAYNPNPADGSSVNGATGEITNGVIGTTYTIEYTTAGTCPEVMSNTVTVNGFTYTAAVTDETCGALDGEIDLTTIGGAVTFTFSIDNGATTQAGGLFTGLAAGSYDVLITDGNGCQSTGTETVANGGGPTMDVITTVDVTCSGANTGEVTITTIGGTGAITYEINNGAGFVSTNATGQFIGIAAGNYDVIVTDANGCQVMDVFVINEPAMIDVVVDRVDINCFGQLTGEISITANGGTPTYTYSIDNGATWSANPDFTGLAAGIYNVLVQDANGCQSAVSVTPITEPTQLAVNLVVVDEACFEDCNGSITWNASGGTPVYTFTYNGNVAGTQSINGLCPNTYNYVLNDANGCSISGSIDVIAALEIIPDPIITVNDGCEDGCDGSISVSSNSGVSYTIGGITNATGFFSGVCSGVYSILITDANGCAATTNAVVSEADPAEANFAYSPGYVTVFDNEVQFMNTSFNADSYIWEITGTNGLNDVINGEMTSYQFPADSGSYMICLTAISSEGCEDTYCLPIVVQEIFTLYVPTAFTPDDDEFNQNFMAYVHGIDIYEFDMFIFNRWGEVVWESHDPSVGWDGTYKGKIVQDGTYTWKITVKDPYSDDRKSYVGHVSILR